MVVRPALIAFRDAINRIRLDIDQLLIFFLLAVTINQMGHWLATFAPNGWGLIGYLQAAGIDLAIWRSAWWYRRYDDKGKRRWALVGVVSFSLVSAAYNYGYYTATQANALHPAIRAFMALVLPLGVALLSYLYGQKETAEPPETTTAFTCGVCDRSFVTQNALAGHAKAHRNGNGGGHNGRHG